MSIVAQELTQEKGGSLDILAADGDRYYSIEVQLGEVDASHGFRVFDYWGKNRVRYPDKDHVAVLVAESAGGRYHQALKSLAEYVPMIVIELRAWMAGTEAVLVPETLFVNESLDISGVASAEGGLRTAEDWKEQCTEEAWEFHNDFVAWVEENLGDVRVDYGPKSYIGVRRGRRVWAPIWPKQDGGTVYLPDPDGSRAEPSVAFERFQERLQDNALSCSWTPNYNAGSNPIGLRLQRADLLKPVVQDLLRSSFKILEPGATPYSQAHPESPEAEGLNAPGADPHDASDSLTDFPTK